MNSILLAATSSSVGMGLFKPLYWLFGVCMGFLMDLLNNKMQEIPGVVATETLISLEQSIKKEIPIQTGK